METKDRMVDLPGLLTPIFAISIRPLRFDNLCKRLGPWKTHVQHWPGTNGELLDKNKMVWDGTVVPRLRRGEIGCYDSHYRLWRHIVDNNIRSALILEDDADITYGKDVVDRIKQMFLELETNKVEWDLIYLGHNTANPPRQKIGSCLGTPACLQGLFMYLITREGAMKLVDRAMPMMRAVDEYVFRLSGYVRQFTLEPRLGWVVTETSDTSLIQ